MLRRVSAVLPIAGLRTNITFTQASPVLQNNAEKLGYKSNVWVEESDLYWIGKQTKVKGGERSTEVVLPRRLELYNFDQVVNPPERDNSVHWPHSLRTGRRYNGAFCDSLIEEARKQQFDSKWWLSVGELRTNNLRLRQDQAPFVSLMNVKTRVYNAEQFENADVVASAPHSGATGRVYSGDTFRNALTAHMKANGFKTPVYFTEKQATVLQIPPQAGAVPATIEFANRDFLKLYNVDEIVNGAQLLVELNRHPVNEPTYLVSGKPLGEKWLAPAKDAPFKSMYWIFRSEVTERNAQLVPGAKGIVMPNQITAKAQMYNAEQLTASLDEVLCAVGTYQGR